LKRSERTEIFEKAEKVQKDFEKVFELKTSCQKTPPPPFVRSTLADNISSVDYFSVLREFESCESNQSNLKLIHLRWQQAPGSGF
jgi:hypothetical protein